MTPETPGGEVAVYEGTDGDVRVDVRLDHETVWLTQRQMSSVFDTTPENVLMHLGNIFRDDELEQAATTKDFLVVQMEGARSERPDDSSRDEHAREAGWLKTGVSFARTVTHSISRTGD